jgi:formate--tetrahydrofolate ligase
MVNSDKPLPITKIAERLRLSQDDLEMYGRYAAKLSLHSATRSETVGKYIGVTAINPTPFGEGKTVVSIGLMECHSQTILRHC